jgi:hypothetical protein
LPLVPEKSGSSTSGSFLNMTTETDDRQNRSKAKPLPPIEYLRELFIVDPTSPSGLRWRVSRGTRIKAGQVAGSISGNFNGKMYWRVIASYRSMKAHRVILSIIHGIDLAGIEVDHINGDGSDNRIENLRIASSIKNNWNRGRAKNNTSGFRGVCWDAQRDKWMAHISANGKFHYLGRFDSLNDARRAREEAELRLHGEFSPLARKEGA